MFNMVKFPYNNRAVSRLDSNNIVHNHSYHECPIGKVNDNIVYGINDNPVGRVDSDGTVHSHHIDNSPIGNVLENGFISKNNALVGRVEDNNLSAGAAYLLLIHDSR